MPWLVLLVFLLGLTLGGAVVLTWHFHQKTRTHDNLTNERLGKALLEIVDHNNDAAMQHLVFLLNQTTDNIDAYIALSNMFRNKGWFHRSIDIRRRLLTRSILTPEKRRDIMRGMVLDYQRAGLVGRAIHSLKTVIDMTEGEMEDFALLAGLYEQSNRLNEAADAWKKAGNNENHAFVRTEIARRMIHQNDLKAARKYLAQTLKIHPDNPAAILIMADMLTRDGKIRQAEKLFNRLQTIRPDLTGVIADLLESIALETDNAMTHAFFADLLQKQKQTPRVAVRYAAYLYELKRKDEAVEVIRNIPTAELAPEMMARLVDVAYRCGEYETAARYGIETIRRFLDNKPFVCHACKELVFSLEWKCPKCGQWGTIRSRRSYSVSP